MKTAPLAGVGICIHLSSVVVGGLKSELGRLGRVRLPHATLLPCKRQGQEPCGHRRRHARITRPWRFILIGCSGGSPRAEDAAHGALAETPENPEDKAGVG